VYIGTARLTFRLPGNDSLKGKRQVSRSLINRLRQRFNVSVAEVGAIDVHQTLIIGMSCVSGDAAYASGLLESAIQFAEQQHVDAELLDVERDVMDAE
jgi:uncharacterized protein YlxP (DUF503 family)